MYYDPVKVIFVWAIRNLSKSTAKYTKSSYRRTVLERYFKNHRPFFIYSSVRRYDGTIKKKRKIKTVAVKCKFAVGAGLRHFFFCVLVTLTAIMKNALYLVTLHSRRWGSIPLKLQRRRLAVRVQDDHPPRTHTSLPGPHPHNVATSAEMNK